MRRASCLLMLALFAGPAFADPATTVREVRLMAKPFNDAAALATLPAGTGLETIGREGGWYQVRATEYGKGWIHMLSLRFGGEAQEKDKGDGVGSLFNLMRGGSGGQTVATGIRGLDGEDLRNASPNPAALAALDGYATTAPSAERFARQGGLKTNRMEHLKQPETQRPNKGTPFGTQP